MAETNVDHTSAIHAPLISSSAIAQHVSQLASSISKQYSESEPILVPILHGAFIFAADLAKAIEIPVTIDFLAISSYVDRDSTGTVQIIKDLESDIKHRDVLIIEDIVDTGHTLTTTLDLLSACQPQSFEVVTLLNKESHRATNMAARWIGFEIDDGFRNLPYITDVTNLPTRHSR